MMNSALNNTVNELDNQQTESDSSNQIQSF